MPTLPFGPVMIDVVGKSLSSYDKEKIQHPNTGAVILFSRNFENAEQVSELINTIRDTRNGAILIAVDQEGGRVQRFQHDFTRLPAAACFEHSPNSAEQAGWLMASELLAIGVDFSFAPVLDVDCGISEIIGNRSFSNNEQTAAQIAGLFAKGMKSAGMSATGKHFPGHGAVALDSHLTLPVDDRELNEIRNKDLYPFKQLIKQGLEAIMPAHVVYSKVDDLPAGFSKFWIQTILRQELSFDGVIFSDDLSMEGAASIGDYPQRAKLALQAGCDMILVCNNPQAADQVLESVPITEQPIRQQRLLTMQGKPLFNRNQLMQSSQWQQFSANIGRLANA